MKIMAENKYQMDEDDLEFFKMAIQANREATFKEWPFASSSRAKCTPAKMAEAGFFHCPTEQEPDIAKCFVCMKELDGWEPTDDPWEEHRSHAPKCPFVTGKRVEKDMKLRDMWKLERARQTNRIRKAMEDRISEFEKYAAQVRSEMEKLAE